jgi:hypothetical protein
MITIRLAQDDAATARDANLPSSEREDRCRAGVSGPVMGPTLDLDSRLVRSGMREAASPRRPCGRSGSAAPSRPVAGHNKPHDRPSPRLVLDLDTPPCFRYAWLRQLSSQVGGWARYPLSSRRCDDDQGQDGKEAAGKEDATVSEDSGRAEGNDWSGDDRADSSGVCVEAGGQSRPGN